MAPISRGRHAGQRLALLQLLHHLLDGTIQLLILAVPLADRVVVDQDVGINAMVLNNPVARLRIVAGEEGHTDVGPVHIGQRAADANDAAPGACADQFA